jgi:GGDEF domain-containing protein
VTWGGHELVVTAAVGTVTWTDRRIVAPDELLAAADERMYADKRGSAQGRQHLRTERLDERHQVLPHVVQVDPVEAEGRIAS